MAAADETAQEVSVSLATVGRSESRWVGGEERRDGIGGGWEIFGCHSRSASQRGSEISLSPRIALAPVWDLRATISNRWLMTPNQQQDFIRPQARKQSPKRTPKKGGILFQPPQPGVSSHCTPILKRQSPSQNVPCKPMNHTRLPLLSN